MNEIQKVAEPPKFVFLLSRVIQVQRLICKRIFYQKHYGFHAMGFLIFIIKIVNSLPQFLIWKQNKKSAGSNFLDT